MGGGGGRREVRHSVELDHLLPVGWCVGGRGDRGATSVVGSSPPRWLVMVWTLNGPRGGSHRRGPFGPLLERHPKRVVLGALPPLGGGFGHPGAL